jgi:diacylglycerol kinase
MEGCIGWRDRRRSRVREVADGAAMMFMDVAVIRTLIVVCVMLVVAFLARKHSTFVTWLIVSAIFFMFCEMFNTITEMLVDRISLSHNLFSARIKHASAFVSAVSGIIAFTLFFVVLYNLFVAPNKEQRAKSETQLPVLISGPARESAIAPSTAEIAIAPSTAESAIAPSTAEIAPSTDGSAESTGVYGLTESKIVHPKLWEKRVAKKKRYRVRRAV